MALLDGQRLFSPVHALRGSGEVRAMKLAGGHAATGGRPEITAVTAFVPVPR